MMLNTELLALLACPSCHSDLVLEKACSEKSELEKVGLLCEKCQKVYPVQDDIPILLIAEAIAKSDWDKDNR